MRAVHICCTGLLIALGALGCRQENLTKTSVVSSDSAGIQLVINGADRLALPLPVDISTNPTLIMGESDGGVGELSTIEAASRLRDGSVVVADGGSKRVLIFDRRGRVARVSGRPGAGPGEFLRLTFVGPYRGDSIIAYDSQQRRVSILDSGGVFRRSFLLTTGLAGDSPERPLLLGAFADGSVLLSSTRIPAVRAGHVRLQHLLIRANPNGTPLDTLGRFPGAEVYFGGEGEWVSVAQPPFARAMLVSVRESSVVVSDNEAFSFTAYSSNGSPERIVRVDAPPRPILPAHLEVLLRRELRGVEDPALETRLRNGQRLMLTHKTLPALQAIHRDPEGIVWAAIYETPGDESRAWLVFGPDGVLLGRTTLPRGFAPTQFGGDYVLGMSETSTGVPVLKVYTVSWRSSRRDALGQ